MNTTLKRLFLYYANSFWNYKISQHRTSIKCPLTYIKETIRKMNTFQIRAICECSISNLCYPHRDYYIRQVATATK